MTVSAMDRNMAIHTSQSSHPNLFVASLPATRVTTTTSAKAGKKKLMKRANIWSPVGSGLDGRARIEAASMTQTMAALSHYQKLMFVLSKHTLEKVSSLAIRENYQSNRQEKDRNSIQKSTGNRRQDIGEENSNSRNGISMTTKAHKGSHILVMDDPAASLHHWWSVSVEAGKVSLT